MIDLHSHVLSELDDGAASLHETLAIVCAAAADGVTAMAATPHVRDDYPTTPARMEAALAQARAAVAEAGLSVELLPGGELALDALRLLDPVELRRFSLAGNPGFLLVEFPLFGWPHELDEEVSRLADNAIRPVLAHPERNNEVQSHPERLWRLVEDGALVQVTASSLASKRRGKTWATAHHLVETGLAHMVASDVHGATVQRGGLRSGRDAVRDRALAKWLTTDVPGAVVRREPIPERPAAAARARIWAPRRWRRSPPASGCGEHTR